MAPAFLPFVPQHGLGGAKDLPVPAPLAIAGGTLALVVSFVVLALAWRRPRYDPPATRRGVPVPALARITDGAGLCWAVRVLGLAFFGWTTWALVAGADSNNNPALGVFYVLVWVGIVPASLLFGRVARALSPVRTLHVVLARALRTDPRVGLVPYPARLGTWPAAVGLFAFVWQELVNPHQVELSSIRLWLVVYLAVMLVGSAVFGDTWLEHADPFEVYSDLLAHLSPWGRDDEGRLVVLSPLAHLARVVPRPGLVAVVAVLFGSTAFDSYKDSLRWVRLVDGLSTDPVWINTGALVLFCLVVGVSFTVAARLTVLSDPAARAAPEDGPEDGPVNGPVVGPAAGRVRRGDLPMLLAHAVVPIVVGYMVAHYLSYFVEQGQQTLVFLSDPLVRGDDYLGTAGLAPRLWLSYHPSVLATIKVLAVVLGHIVGAVAAHDRALTLLPRRAQVTGQLAMLAVMVCYTFAGLYLLFGS
ncbi:MAG: hypothetical protein ACTHNS_16095 [Marmoricola sp.]